MLVTRLPYRIQIPLGLSLAVVLTALLVTTMAVRQNARAVREDSLTRVDRAGTLLAAQARPLIAADDTWRVYVLLRDTAGLLPGGESGLARAAILDADGRTIAGSAPAWMPTGATLAGWSDLPMPLAGAPDGLTASRRSEGPGGGILSLRPIRSEDGQSLGFVAIEVDAPVFANDWTALSRPAAIAAALSVAMLVPAGWWMGRRMARPIERVAGVIGRISGESADRLHAELPPTADPELGRIQSAVKGWLDGIAARDRAERRALSAERMAAVGRLTAAVAHEINNPLAGLLTATRTLRTHGNVEATRLRTVDLLERGLEQIRSTVSSLLPQTRSDTRCLDFTDLEDVAALAAPAARVSGVTLRTAADFVTAARVPAVVLRQVMLNLMLNAIKAAEGEGTVEASLAVDPGRVTFRISNSGAQLTQTDLQLALEAENGDDPRGFGLWVCREIATQFAGGFHVDEQGRASTTLEFWIPNREQHEADAADRG